MTKDFGPFDYVPRPQQPPSLPSLQTLVRLIDDLQTSVDALFIQVRLFYTTTPRCVYRV